jgi:hypothetical protein
MTDYAKKAAVIADNQRAALALIRAMRDESYDDAVLLLEATSDKGSAYDVMITLAKFIASNVDERWLDRKLDECNEMDLGGAFERFLRTRGCSDLEDLLKSERRPAGSAGHH